MKRLTTGSTVMVLGAFACTGGQALFSDAAPSNDDTSSSSTAQGGATGQGGSTSAAGGGDAQTSGPSSGPGGSTSGTGGAPPGCGNGVIDGEEACDGDQLNGHSCQEYGFSNPDGVSCNANCQIDPGGCEAECGNGDTEPGEQCDDDNGNDDDGCTNCQFDGTDCNSQIPIELDGTLEIKGTTENGGKHSTYQCNNEHQATDRVFAVTPKTSGYLTASLDPTGTDYDSVLYALNDCVNPASGILCVDNYEASSSGGMDGGEVISFEVEGGVTYAIVVDGFSGQDGDFALTLDLSAGTCADPVAFPLFGGGLAMTALGSTQGDGDDLLGVCGGTLSPDVVYALTTDFDGQVAARLRDEATNFDSVIYGRSDCSSIASEFDCDHNDQGSDEIDCEMEDGVTQYVVVDGHLGAEGNYALRFTP